MELHYVYIQSTSHLRHILCERVAVVAGGFWLYRYMPRYDKFIDAGYASDLNQLKLILTERYGRFDKMLLVRDFEEVVKLFAREHPRVIHLMPGETFCTQISGEVLDCELHRNGEVGFIKKWISGMEKPKNLQEVLERLDEYARKNGTWVIFKRYPSNAFAYLAYPSP
jgi:hypothetical protein